MSDQASRKLRPLDGVRIIDLSTVLMGPLATQILADYGADVIKVEPPQGDVMRNAGSMRHPKMGSLYIHSNRNKRSVVLDLKRPIARMALLQMCRTSDVLVHNIRPAAMSRLNLGYSDIAAENPAIIYLSLTGFGQTGLYARRTAVDDVVQAASGLADLYAKSTGQEPAYVPSVVADRITGISAAHALLAALIYRMRTGRGQSVEVPMFETLVSHILGDHLSGKTFEPAAGPMGYSRLLTPFRRPYRTCDGYIAATVYTDKQWQTFWAALGRQALIVDERFKDAAVRAKNYDAAYKFLNDAFVSKSTGEWQSLLDYLDVPCMPVNSLEDLLEDPHLKSVSMFESHEHPSEGSITTMKVPSTWSECDLSLRRHAPVLGEHSREVFREFGINERDIAQLMINSASVEI